MFTTLRPDVTSRLTEVRQLLDLIRELERDPPAIDSPEVRILRGLFFVHLYAALEFTVSQGVQRILDEIGKLSASVNHLEARFLSIALDANFSSLRNIGEEKRWPTRIKLIDAQSSNSVAAVSSDLFALYLQNIKVARLETIFQCLHIGAPVVPDPAYRLYVDELVEMRNGVAHGRFSASGTGGRMRSGELSSRLTAITAVCTHVLDCFDQQHSTKHYIRAEHRGNYA